jgi:redox-sensitive bicupin YhaK (pirin superfamily)
VTIWAGNLSGVQALAPPPNSWGSDPKSELAVLYIELEPGGSFIIPAAAGGANVNRCAYFIEGEAVKIGSQNITSKSSVTLNAGNDVEIMNNGSTAKVEVLLLQGKPLNEPVAQQGPFVMNTQAELRQSFDEYRRTQFGGWPWERDDMVFPKEKPRFSLQNGIETFPPSVSDGNCAAKDPALK